MIRSALVVVLALVSFNTLAIDIPVSLDKQFSIELVAQEPDIVTPTGVSVDARGRIWVLENHTHQTPKNYKGNATDRIKIMEDFGPDGKARKITTFAEGFKNSMSILVAQDGGVYFATRSQVYLLREKDGVEDLAARKTIATLETAGNYPHNGLAGLTFGPDGKSLFFGLGENLGADYKLVGSDGVSLSGGGEGGNVYRCGLDGGKLEKVATGFWNPWGLCFDAAGRLFAVENDPDSRPPCRLLHVVQDGDYGYKFRYGRKGTHPFISWNGEIPGTLPMVAPTGEAPCAVYAMEAPGLPKEFRGDLLVTSWGDHEVQRFKLVPNGASFTSQQQTLIKGTADFRPVGLAPAPDGSLVMTDWVSSSYPVHGKGRVWRIRCNAAEKIVAGDAPRHVKNQSEKFVDEMNSPLSSAAVCALEVIDSVMSGPPQFFDPFAFHAAICSAARITDSKRIAALQTSNSAITRLGALLALRKINNETAKAEIPKFLADPDSSVRRAAIQWVGEERLKEFAPQLNDVTKLPMTRELFQAFLASKSLLSGDKPDKGEYVESQMAQIFPSDKHPAAFRALALKYSRVDHPGTSVAVLVKLLEEKDAGLRAEAVKALALHPQPAAQVELKKLALDTTLGDEIRADVLAGLARSAEKDAETQKILLDFLKVENVKVLQIEALRALRGAAGVEEVKKSVIAVALKEQMNKVSVDINLSQQALATLRLAGVEIPESLKDLSARVSQRPSTEAEWLAFLSKANPADSAAAGARVFYHVRGAQCFGCHKVNGRGGSVGPDLTSIGKSGKRERIVQSILDPSRDVAPQFVPWTFILKDGRRVTGMIVEENNGTVVVGESTSNVIKLRLSEIEQRVSQKGSVMPDNLAAMLTPQEMSDLMAFLMSN